MRTKTGEKIPREVPRGSSPEDAHATVVLVGAGAGCGSVTARVDGGKGGGVPPMGSIQMIDAVGKMYIEQHE